MTAASEVVSIPFLGDQQDVRLVGEVKTDSDTLVTAARIVMLGLLTSLIWKIRYFVGGIAITFHYPVVDPFFPRWLQSSVTFAGMYFGYLLLLVALAFKPRRRHSVLITVMMTLFAFGMVVHQHSYNDMTFFTVFWVSLWLTWFLSRINCESAKELLPRAVFLSHVVLSMILLGGAVGKYTPGYWSGEVMYEIYFKGRDYWVFEMLRSVFSGDDLRQVAAWYSRFIIVVESAGGMLWLLPPRVASAMAILILCGIFTFSNWFLVSVLACLIGLASIAFLNEKATDEMASSAA
ncbi:MAG: hypothetical protein R3C03_05015 [Pirellulaceae bacterium]